MHIDKYKFGRIEIDDIEYNADLIIYPDHIKANWWRKETHNLLLSDIDDIESYTNLKTILVGTGYMGFLKVSKKLKEYCDKKGIRIFAMRTKDAVVEFNHLSSSNTISCFHLTC